MIKSLQPPYIDYDNKQQSIAELLMFVRDHSPFYRQLYQHVAHDSICIEDYPILPLEAFWKANSTENNLVLTTTATAGITFQTSSTVGKNYSVYNNQEWDNFTHAIGKALRWGGLQADEQIGNYIL